VAEEVGGGAAFVRVDDERVDDELDQVVRVLFQPVLQRVEVLDAREFGVHVEVVLLEAELHRVGQVSE